MPSSKYIRVVIDDEEVDLPPASDLPISISYKLEDKTDFQSKQTSKALDITLPATVKNDQVANTFHNPGVEDMTPDQTYRRHRRGLIEANGYELMVGKAFLKQASHSRTPIDYVFDFYGNNADWAIDLQDATLFDFLKQINFTFTKQRIIDSWAFDGTSEVLPYVFAPVRYGRAMDTYKPAGGAQVVDKNMAAEYMRPSLSKYWIIYWAFKSLGYKIDSDFFDTPFFRRQVMPWVWGSFLDSDGTRLDTLDFLAKSTQTVDQESSFTGVWDVKVFNDSVNGAFDNNGVYEYTPGFRMKWTYIPTFNYGTLQGTFHFNMFVSAVATANSDVELRIRWYKNGVRIPNGNDNGNGTLLVNLNAPAIGTRRFDGPVDDWFTALVDPGDIIEAEMYLHIFDSGTGIGHIHGSVDAFELDYFRIPLGGLINFENYNAFKKYKFLDFLRGVVDEFNIAVQTDPINKVVTMEPLHDYSLTNDLSVRSGGYLNGRHLSWEEKQDLSKKSVIESFDDADREQLFKYKDDGSDGILKKIQDRFTNILAQGKYVLPDRFKTGKDEIENRFFAPLMHYEVVQWKGLGSDPDAMPQMPCLIPENISNTSRGEAQNTFAPKSAYYKGLVNHVGWVFDKQIRTDFPFMFSVNYQEGGEDDPVLSYSDERIGELEDVVGSGSGTGDVVIAKGLLKRFYWQRLANMREGKHYQTFFKLNNLDVTNWLHREHIIVRGQRWELVEINEYLPLEEQSAGCYLRKWAPISERDQDNTFPSEENILSTTTTLDPFDIKYAPLKCLSSDIPIPE